MLSLSRILSAASRWRRGSRPNPSHQRRPQSRFGAEDALEDRRLMAVTQLVSVESARAGPIRFAIATFSGPLKPNSAVNSGNYRFIVTGRDGVFGTRDDIALPVTIGRRGQNAVFITPRATLSPRIPVLVCVRQGLRDRQGQLVDNNRDGSPGGNACVILRGDPIGPRVAAAPAISAGSGHWRSVKPIR